MIDDLTTKAEAAVAAFVITVAVAFVTVLVIALVQSFGLFWAAVIVGAFLGLIRFFYRRLVAE